MNYELINKLPSSEELKDRFPLNTRTEKNKRRKKTRSCRYIRRKVS